MPNLNDGRRDRRHDSWAVWLTILLVAVGVVLFGWIPELLGVDLWP